MILLFLYRTTAPFDRLVMFFFPVLGCIRLYISSVYTEVLPTVVSLFDEPIVCAAA